MPRMRGSKGAGVLEYSKPLPTKQMRHNGLTKRAIFYPENRVTFSMRTQNITSRYSFEHSIAAIKSRHGFMLYLEA